MLVVARVRLTRPSNCPGAELKKMTAEFEKTFRVAPAARQSGDTYIQYWQLWHHNWDDADIACILKNCSVNGKRVLEVGCGDGRVAFSLASFCQELEAIDLDPRLIDIAEERLNNGISANLRFAVMDAQKLAFANETFDVVLFPWVLQMIQNPFLAIQEAFRVLKEQGELLVIGLRSDADYDKIIAHFVPNMPAIDPIIAYEKPILSQFRAKLDLATQQFSYFFETKEIAVDAFAFAINRWYSTELKSKDQKKLVRIIDHYQDGERVRIIFPANIYRVVKP